MKAYQERVAKSGPVICLDHKTMTPTKPKISARQRVYVNSDKFLGSFEWRKLRMKALKLHGARCQCCGASPKDGIRIHVDHIKPRRTHPHLALDLDNLQVLCEVCNHGKGSWDDTDWRQPEEEDTLFAENVVHLRSILRED